MVKCYRRRDSELQKNTLKWTLKSFCEWKEIPCNIEDGRKKPNQPTRVLYANRIDQVLAVCWCSAAAVAAVADAVAKRSKWKQQKQII